MPKESVIRVGCLRIADHFIAGVTNSRAEKEDIGFSSFKLQLDIMDVTDQIVESLTKGEIAGAFLPLPFAMELFRTGLGIKLILFANKGGGIFVKNKSSAITSVKDFKDKVILTPCLLSVENILLHKMFLLAGLKLGLKKENGVDVILEKASTNMVPEIIENDSDNDIGGFVAPDPFAVEAANKKNCKEMFKFNSLWTDYPNSVFVIHESIIQDAPESVVELVNAFTEAGRIINKGEDKALTSYAEAFFKQDSETVKNMLTTAEGMHAPAKLTPDYSIVEIVQDYIVDEAGFMSNKIDILQFLDPSFIC